MMQPAMQAILLRTNAMNEIRKLMEALDEIENNSSPIKAVLTDYYDAEPDDDEYWSSGPGLVFDIFYGDKKIGELQTSQWGEFIGIIGNRAVELENPWTEMPEEFEDQTDYYYVEGRNNERSRQFWTDYVTWLVNRYFNFEKGQKHLALIKRNLTVQP